MFSKVSLLWLVRAQVFLLSLPSLMGIQACHMHKLLLWRSLYRFWSSFYTLAPSLWYSALNISSPSLLLKHVFLSLQLSYTALNFSSLFWKVENDSQTYLVGMHSIPFLSVGIIVLFLTVCCPSELKYFFSFLTEWEESSVPTIAFILSRHYYHGF